MSLPNGQKPFDCVEVRFKNSRKEFFRNTENLTLSIGDAVATEASPGHDVGIVTLVGELVKVQMKKKGADPDDPALPKVYRKASQKDIDIWQTARDREAAVQKRSRELAISLGLEMKISDVEFQGDGSKATFYYTAEGRVDFRQLIKDMARAFNIRIEMRQIGYRQEASRLGGIGSCGRELCCSTWLTDFRSVNTASARYQQLSLNPQKLAGQCGKLKCCLNYELDAYLDALKEFPKQDIKLETGKGPAVCQKIDIFKGLMWYAYEGDWVKWHVLSVDQVNTILDKNKAGEEVAGLEDFAIDLTEDTKKDFENVVGQDSLTRFDRPKNRRKNTKRTKGRPKQGGKPKPEGTAPNKAAGPNKGPGSGKGTGQKKNAPSAKKGGGKGKGNRNPNKRRNPRNA